MAVYTALFGSEDVARDLTEYTADVPAFAFTEHVDLWGQTIKGWQLVAPGFSMSWEHQIADSSRWIWNAPRFLARQHKIRSLPLFGHAEYTLWMDARIKYTSPLSPIELAEHYFKGRDTELVLHQHRWRDCIYDEIRVCRKQRLDDPAALNRAEAGNRQRGVVEHAGLYETGVLLRRNAGRLIWFEMGWWNEVVLTSFRDQISFPEIARTSGLNFTTFPGRIDKSPHFELGRHWKRAPAKY